MPDTRQDYFEWLFGLAPLANTRSVAEIEPGDGALARFLLRQKPEISYTGVFREGVPALAEIDARAKFVRGGAEGELPLETSSVDMLFTAFALERMRMAHLYMACSEARRVLPTGAHWAILARDPGSNRWEKFISYCREKTGERFLNVHHYISPEDWEIVSDQIRSGRRALILRRLAG